MSLPFPANNFRDLGGLPAGNGSTRFGVLYRSGDPDRLSTTEWNQLLDLGITSIVDLRNADERKSAPDRPSVLAVALQPVEDQGDQEFMTAWGLRLGSPAYYPEVLRRWPALVAGAVSAVADAGPGAVLVHCGAGRDRTGMISALLLTLAGVHRAAILDDYEAGVRGFNQRLLTEQLNERWMPDDELDAHVGTARAELDAFLDGVDAEDYLLEAGLRPDQLAAIRTRLLG